MPSRLRGGRAPAPGPVNTRERDGGGWGRGQEASGGPGRPARPRDVAPLAGISPRGPRVPSSPPPPALLPAPRLGAAAGISPRSSLPPLSLPPSPPSVFLPSFPLRPSSSPSRSFPSSSHLSPSLFFSPSPSRFLSPTLPPGFLPRCPPSSLPPLPLRPSQPRGSQLPVCLPEPAPPPALAAGPARPAPGVHPPRSRALRARRDASSLPARGPARPGPRPEPQRAEDVSPARLWRSSSHSRAEPERSAAQPRALSGPLARVPRSCPSGVPRPLAGATAAAARGPSPAGRPRPQRR
ncbi:hypothetical protein H8959_005621 [Pygathrix nigripes]